MDALRTSALHLAVLNALAQHSLGRVLDSFLLVEAIEPSTVA
ncbi:hypothetical protein ACWEQH_30675 [Streptomyces sp. NPDC004166]